MLLIILSYVYAIPCHMQYFCYYWPVQHGSWSKRSSSLALTTATLSCLRSQTQHIQNPAACRVFNLPKFSHVTPFFRNLHWLPVIARIRFKTLVLAFKAGSAELPLPTSYLLLAPQWWNELLAESLASFRKRLKTHRFRVHLGYITPPPPHLPSNTSTNFCLYVLALLIVLSIV